MSRIHSDWLKAFMEYCDAGEAPRYMYFWSGVSAIAGALQRKVWFDMGHFKWYPNFYILLVAPPGVVAKSTTSGIAMKLLRGVPGVKFGPKICTWQAMVSCFSEARETFNIEGKEYVQCALTLESSEFGNLFDPDDREMTDLLVDLWDGSDVPLEKRTKTKGSEIIENPWINLIACTTPSWIASHFHESLIGGGFTSRCVFVYANKKSKLSAYPFTQRPSQDQERFRIELLMDLEKISQLKGEYKLEPSALEWGTKWYEYHCSSKHSLSESNFGGYIARKQSHIHKLAMVLAAATSDSLVITRDHLETANIMITDLERDMEMVFSKIGKTKDSVNADKIVEFVDARGKMRYQEVYNFAHSMFPNAKDFEAVVAGCVKSGHIKLIKDGNDYFLESAKESHP